MTQQPHGQAWPPPDPYGQGPQTPHQPGQVPVGGWQQARSQPQGWPYQPHDQWQQPRPGSQPLGTQQQPRVSIDDFTRPPSRRPMWLALGVLVAVGALLAAMFHFAGTNPSAPAEATPSVTAPVGEPSTSPTATAPPTVAPPTTNQVPFENSRDDSKGTFEIVSSQWQGQNLVLDVKITLTEGEQTINFFCLDNDSSKAFEPVAGAPDDLVGRRVAAGETAEGTVTFEKPSGATTVFFADSNGRQVAALVVNA